MYNNINRTTAVLTACDPEKEFAKAMDFFRFSDYDCIGFDLDSTILHYKIANLVQLQYGVITNYLIDKKGYNADYFKDPLTKKDLDFLQKGLVFDFERGNVVKINREGKIHRASHGTKLLNAEEIENYYPNREWDLSKRFSENPLMIWGPSNSKIRTLLHNFDMPAGLVFAKLVDALDKDHGKVLDRYEIWPDILDALTYMFKRDHLKNNDSNFYSEMNANPSKYIHRCNPKVLAWLKDMRKERKTFLLTGSDIDFVELTTSYAFNEDLKSLFDIIICFGLKPGFFTTNRSFYSLKCNYEDAAVTGSELQVGKIYNQGNWKDLMEFFSRITNVKNPRCLYVGDNLLQDIYAPSRFTNCDTLVVSDEQLAEKILHYDLCHSDESTIVSNAWGSFFSLKTTDSIEESFWTYIIKRHAKICVPNLEIFLNKPLDIPIKCFKQDRDQELRGFYPEKPVTLLHL